MKSSSMVIIIYIAGLLFGAFFLDLWGAETSIKKGLMAIGWTTIFLISLFYVENK